VATGVPRTGLAPLQVVERLYPGPTPGVGRVLLLEDHGEAVLPVLQGAGVKKQLIRQGLVLNEVLETLWRGPAVDGGDQFVVQEHVDGTQAGPEDAEDPAPATGPAREFGGL